MIQYLHGGEIFDQGAFHRADLLCVGGRIAAWGQQDPATLDKLGIQVTVIDCSGKYIIPGLVDPHLHLSGGSGEKGFHSQSFPVLISECIEGGVTTVVGTLGVDTSTKTMLDLLAKAKAYNEIGLSAYCYVGGYDIPPTTVTGSVRDDIMLIPEIIGVGEIAVADARAPEPNLDLLARAVVDAYVGGLLSQKVGIAHFHMGGADRGFKTIYDLMESHTVYPSKLYVTHVERSEKLFADAVQFAKHGGYIDIDVYEQKTAHWFKRYQELGGPMGRMTVSSDAGFTSTRDLWQEIRDCVLEHQIPLTEILPLFSANSAKVLEFKTKGHLREGADADIIVCTKTDLEITEVLARGKVFMRDRQLVSKHNPLPQTRRGFDLYEIQKQDV